MRADQSPAELLSLIAAEEGLSTARACKRLGLSRSELQRMLSELCGVQEQGGLDLVRVEDCGSRQRLWLGPAARRAL